MPPTPKGFWRSWFAPAPKPSRETLKQRTSSFPIHPFYYERPAASVAASGGLQIALFDSVCRWVPCYRTWPKPPRCTGSTAPRFVTGRNKQGRRNRWNGLISSGSEIDDVFSRPCSREDRGPRGPTRGTHARATPVLRAVGNSRDGRLLAPGWPRIRGSQLAPARP